MVDSDINYDEFSLVINEEQSYFMVKIASEHQLDYVAQDKLIEHSKTFEQNERRQNLKFKTYVSGKIVKFIEFTKNCDNIPSSAERIQRVKTQRSKIIKIGE